MPKNKKEDITGDVKYLELLAGDFRDYMKESRDDLVGIRDTISNMKSEFSRELGGIQQAITGSNARIKKLEDGHSNLKSDFSSLSVKHPNGSLRHLLWKVAPWLVTAVITGAAFTGYAFSEFMSSDPEMIEMIEDRMNKKIEKEVDKLSDDIDYLIEQEQDGGV